jgi:hypothetical protein
MKVEIDELITFVQSPAFAVASSISITRQATEDFGRR